MARTAFHHCVLGKTSPLDAQEQLWEQLPWALCEMRAQSYFKCFIMLLPCLTPHAVRALTALYLFSCRKRLTTGRWMFEKAQGSISGFLNTV